MAAAPRGRASAQPGEQLVLAGGHLSGAGTVRILSNRLAEPRRLNPDAVADDEVRVTVPASDPVPAGTVGVSVVRPVAGGTELASNTVPVGLAPMLTGAEPVRARRTQGRARVTVGCHPPVGTDQVAGLLIGERIVPADPADPGAAAARAALSFTLDGFEAGTYVLRLRVDGQDSIPLAADGHAFDDRQTLVLT